MKNLIVCTMASLILGGVSFAQVPGSLAGSIQNEPANAQIERFTLSEMNINPSSPLLGEQDFVGGELAINHATNEVTASFYRPMPICPPGHMCPMFMPAPVVIRLPITYIGYGYCGGLVIQAQKVLDRDSGLTKMSLIDESTNTCVHRPVKEFTLNVTLTEKTNIVSTFIGR